MSRLKIRHLIQNVPCPRYHLRRQQPHCKTNREALPSCSLPPLSLLLREHQFPPRAPASLPMHLSLLLCGSHCGNLSSCSFRFFFAIFPHAIHTGLRPSPRPSHADAESMYDWLSSLHSAVTRVLAPWALPALFTPEISPTSPSTHWPLAADVQSI